MVDASSVQIFARLGIFGRLGYNFIEVACACAQADLDPAYP